MSVIFLSSLIFSHKHFLHIFKDFSYEFAFSYLFEQICFEFGEFEQSKIKFLEFTLQICIQNLKI